MACASRHAPVYERAAQAHVLLRGARAIVAINKQRGNGPAAGAQPAPGGGEKKKIGEAKRWRTKS